MKTSKYLFIAFLMATLTYSLYYGFAMHINNQMAVTVIVKLICLDIFFTCLFGCYYLQ